MRKLLSILFLITGAALTQGPRAQAQTVSVRWSASLSDGEVPGEKMIVFSGTPTRGWHTYDVSEPQNAPYIETNTVEGCTLEGGLISLTEPKEGTYGEKIFDDSFRLGQKIKPTSGKIKVSGTLTWMGCKDTQCNPPEDWNWSIEEQVAISPASGGEDGDKSLWLLVVEALVWGFVMILTPCVFPMIPMTVSYFMKDSSAMSGRFKALMYGVFIILLYTVPVSIIIGMTRLIGGEAVTADIFNWLSTHWIPNIIFFAVFLIFALSFFGAFEITLPSRLVNKSDSKSDKKGLAGVFFMALTLVLVSFSCTGPIVGTVLIKSTQGEFWAPMVTMLAFSSAFALGFTLFAIFPSILKNGPWMNSVKVVFGFLELAFGLKFLSVADQTYHWHILDREVYLALWIVIFALLGFYLLGKIRFKYDEKVEHIGIPRLALSIAAFSFVVYMIPGMWGAPLKGISGFLPPLESQDFVMGSPATSAPRGSSQSRYDLKMPLGLVGYFSVEEGLEAAKRERKPLFVDITGHGCVNCREMEQRVWSDERVLSLLRERFVLVALYMDDKTRLDEDEWITTESGKVLKDLGRVNSYTARTLFGVNAQPNYVILGLNGEALSPVRGYNLNIEEYIDFLHGGLEAFDRAYHKL